MVSVDERVQAGAAWLDEHRPGWWQRINLDTLDLGNGCDCVLGQEYGGFTNGTGDVDDSESWAQTCAGLGFYALRDDDVETERNYRDLTAAWRALITARRVVAGVAG